ncbi:MAG TPA: 5-deoxy-glucuronate isomerase [Candidatus Cybelea sp.]|nr:5-deoxy-glucuronate isomerase [Candidatus Cybelea sp.]
MTLHLANNRKGFPLGMTWVTKVDDPEDNTGIAFGVYRLKAGETAEQIAQGETAWLLMTGSASISVGNVTKEWTRGSIFDESPKCVHVPSGTTLRLRAEAETEFTVYRTANTKTFEPKFYDKVANEHRGKGQVGDACLRFVRTIFDRSNSDPNAELVLGEVITMPGRWSSYPPHHHPQPEIYHYRFTEPQGYGLAENGPQVFRVKQYDTVKIFDGNDHAQTAAPGYGMYYAWVIRHLPSKPYGVPDFTDEHKWVMEKNAPFWFPKELKDGK